MNIQEADILKILIKEEYINQRQLAEASGYSLGAVNHALKSLQEGGYLDKDLRPTDKAMEECRAKKPKNAIILAAGFGMRMVPINLAAPKAFLEVNGESLIERTIMQLKQAGINDISIVVGFMKERFDYLIDEYGVKLIVNPEYASKNNLSSLAAASDRIGNTYIIPSDIRCEMNPYSDTELYSWYMVSERLDEDSEVRVNRKGEAVRTGENEKGNAMIGISYLLEEDAANIRKTLRERAADSRYDHEFWESVLYRGNKMIIPARTVDPAEVVEINTYEQLREIDENSDQLRSEALEVIAEVFKVRVNDIKEISVLKKGMTNRSFLFSIHGKKYIMRIPGEGTDRLINRAEEAEVYRTVSGHGLCDDPVYIDPESGYKITRFLEGVRVCDAENTKDLKRCMDKLRSFHEMKLKVGHSFDIFGQIEFYEKLRKGQPSMYKDYDVTKANVMKLKAFIDAIPKENSLTHIDAVPDNFLFHSKGNKEELQLTDWEYSGMQDPHVDIAMFCIYRLYDKAQADRLIDIYFRDKCDEITRRKIYAYIAICGLLWSNWCEFKAGLGIEFGEYSLRQYRYAKDYYRYATEGTETE